MKRLHRHIAVLVGWIGFVFLVANFNLDGRETTILSIAIYGVTMMAAIAPLSQFFRNQGPIHIGGGLLLIYGAALLLDLRQMPDQLYLYLVLIGLLLIAVTFFFSWRLGLALAEFFEVVEMIIFSSQGRFVPNIQEAQPQIGNQIYNSRRNQRPLSLILVDTNLASLKREPNQIVTDVQNLIAERYLQMMVAKELANELRRSDLIIGSTKQGRLVLLAPDTGTEGAQILGERIVATLERRMELKVNYSFAAFPHHGLTFEGLLEVAESSSETHEVKLP